jgi:hypothetical protein
VSNTEGLAQISMDIMRKHGVAVDLVRAVDHDIPVGPGVPLTRTFQGRTRFGGAGGR